MGLIVYNNDMKNVLQARYYVEYMLFRAAMGLVNLFPMVISTWIMRRIGEIMCLAMPKRRKVAFDNLNIAFGDSKTPIEKRKIVTESFRNLLTSFMEFFRLPKFIKVAKKHIRFEGLENIDKAFAKGKGAVLAMSHLGSWEYVGFIPYLNNYKATILVRAIRNPFIYKYVDKLRNLMELKHWDKDMGVREIFSELKKNHGVAVVIDQWAGNDGIWVNFFSAPTSTTPLPARLVKRTGCALISGYCIRERAGKYLIRIDPEIKLDINDENFVEKTTVELNRLLENNIRHFPGQWAWTHRRWKDKRI